MHQRHSFLTLCLMGVLTAGLALTLTGCGMVGGAASSSHSTSALTAGQFTGNVHGGQQPVVGSSVKLWAAGTTGASPAGYGANSTLIASTTTDSSGNFSFNNVSGVSPCTIGQYLYITSTGGDSGSGVNSQLALMSAIPTPCSAATGGMFVNVNELTTVATVTALQQFMSVAPGSATPWKIGAPTTNLTGLVNAFLMVSNMVNVSTGVTATSNVSNAVSSTVGGVVWTTIVNPDYAKLNTLGDILAYCVNSVGGNSCNALFSDTTPNAATAPTDTIQAAYYLATNPAGLTMPAHGNSQGSPYYLCSTYVSSTAPFQPTLPCSTTAYPADWAIGISFKTTSPASTAAVGTLATNSVAIDAGGNIWTSTAGATGNSTNGSIAEFNVTGLMQFTPVTSTTISTTAGWSASNYSGTGTYPIGGSRPYSLAIDTLGNAWVGDYYTAPVTISGNTAVSGGTYETPLLEVTPAGVSTGYLVGESPGALAIDGSNNIYLSNIPNQGPTVAAGTSRYYFSELSQAPATGSTIPYTNFYTGIGRGTGIFGAVTVDQSTSQYAIPFLAACASTLYRTNDTINKGNGVLGSANTGVSTVTLSTTTPTCALSGAPDASNNIWAVTGLTSGSVTTPSAIEYINIGSTPATPTVTSFASGTGPTQGGLDSPANIAIDGIGNVWVANNVGSTTGGISAFVPSSNGTMITPKSPAGSGIYGFGSSYGYAHPVGAVIDGSGNVWIETTGGSYLNFLVGIAAPVVTPTSLAVKNTALAVRP